MEKYFVILRGYFPGCNIEQTKKGYRVSLADGLYIIEFEDSHWRFLRQVNDEEYNLPFASNKKINNKTYAIGQEGLIDNWEYSSCFFTRHCHIINQKLGGHNG